MYEIKQKEYCRLTGLTRKALLIYESTGLLTPRRIDGDTGYRFYGPVEIERGTQIALLRALTFSVGEIEQLLDSPEDHSALLRKKEIELHRLHIQITQGLHFLSLSQKSSPFYSGLHEETLSLYQVASIEGRGSQRDLTGHLKQLGLTALHYGMVATGPMGTYYYADSAVEQFHYKVFLPIAGEWLTSIPGVVIENLGAPLFRSVRHYGSYELLPQSYKRLHQELTTQKHPFRGDYLELYHTVPQARLNGDTTTLITDVGVPLWS